MRFEPIFLKYIQQFLNQKSKIQFYTVIVRTMKVKQTNNKLIC